VPGNRVGIHCNPDANVSPGADHAADRRFGPGYDPSKRAGRVVRATVAPEAPPEKCDIFV